MHCALIVVILFLASTIVEPRGETTELNDVVTRIFSRQKRFLLFPDGANLKFTGSISKRLLSTYPKGVSFTLEQALYYPVPTKRIDVYPKHLRPTTTKKPPKPPTTPTYVWIPGSNWRFKAQHVKPYKYIKAPFIPPRRRIDANLGTQYVNASKWSKYGQKYENYQWQPSKESKWTKWTTKSPKWNTNYGQKWKSHYAEPDVISYKPARYPELEHLTDWRYYQGHRDRRELFEHLEGFSKLFGTDMKSCLMRAMCDSRRLLLPPGYSMFQDIIRLIFTMPTISGVDDDYSQTMRSSNEECSRQMHEKCKINILSWIFGGKWQ